MSSFMSMVGGQGKEGVTVQIDNKQYLEQRGASDGKEENHSISQTHCWRDFSECSECNPNNPLKEDTSHKPT
jgi:hypothetical protein